MTKFNASFQPPQQKFEPLLHGRGGGQNKRAEQIASIHNCERSYRIEKKNQIHLVTMAQHINIASK